MNKISIVIPIYNAEKYLERCLESVINQEVSKCELEVILINDGSLDSSIELCEKYEKKFSYVKVFSQENKGVSAARNFGIAMSSGEYIQFVDADDEIKPNMVKDLVDNMVKNKVDLVICNYDTIVGNRVKRQDDSYNFKCINRYEFYNQFGNLYVRRMINPVWNKLYRKNIIETNNISFDVSKRYGEDLTFNLSYISRSNKFCILTDKLYLYYDNVDSATSKFRENWYKSEMDTLNRIRNHLRNEDAWNEGNVLDVCSRMAKGYKASLLMLHHKDSKYSTKEKQIKTKEIAEEYESNKVFEQIERSSYFEKLLLYLTRRKRYKTITTIVAMACLIRQRAYR